MSADGYNALAYLGAWMVVSGLLTLLLLIILWRRMR